MHLYFTIHHPHVLSPALFLFRLAWANTQISVLLRQGGERLCATGALKLTPVYLRLLTGDSCNTGRQRVVGSEGAVEGMVPQGSLHHRASLLAKMARGGGWAGDGAHSRPLSGPVVAVDCMMWKPETRNMCLRERSQGMLFRQMTEGEQVWTSFIFSLRARCCQEGRLVSEDKEGRMASPVPSSRSQRDTGGHRNSHLHTV